MEKFVQDHAVSPVGKILSFPRQKPYNKRMHNEAPGAMEPSHAKPARGVGTDEIDQS